MYFIDDTQRKLDTDTSTAGLMNNSERWRVAPWPELIRCFDDRSFLQVRPPLDVHKFDHLNILE